MRGRCTCGEVVYELAERPMFVHCCHCRWCQRETGAAFALNAIIEFDRLRVLAGTPEVIDTPSESGRGQKIARCPTCKVALWSTYSSPAFRFVRVGTLDDPDACPPDIHIFTESKQPWMVIPEGAMAVPVYYDVKKCWPAESLLRRNLVKARLNPS
ncbi:GFA family protein [Tropicimonas sp. IMCC34043]|uniref:GFA family protein n=1 Tax=Tropicimonas sp. IMCC34043 TaxID=2248760 RepID=UPI000E2458D9|nr:GFA family protein [Tropicimonas sp. IMCC34043]